MVKKCKVLQSTEFSFLGCVFIFWVADWFAQLNNKMDGDLKKIRMIGQYMIGDDDDDDDDDDE